MNDFFVAMESRKSRRNSVVEERKVQQTRTLDEMVVPLLFWSVQPTLRALSHSGDVGR